MSGNKANKATRVVNTSRASEIPRKRVARDISPEMQQSPARRPRVAKANTSTKATQTSERRPTSPIPDSVGRNRSQNVLIPEQQHHRRVQSSTSCLVDQRGRTPRQYPHSVRDNGSENGTGETWPPVRLVKGKKHADTNRPSHMAAQHHPFSQIQKKSTKWTIVGANTTRVHIALTMVLMSQLSVHYSRRYEVLPQVLNQNQMQMPRLLLHEHPHRLQLQGCSPPLLDTHSEYTSTISNVNAAPAHPFPTSAFTFTPPLHLPFQAPPANATPPLLNHGHGGASNTLLTPHPPDVPLAAAQGLTSILSAMSVNHGLMLDVVVAVYKRAGSLRETDTVLEGMREAAEEWAESALKRMGHRWDSCNCADTDENYELEPWYRKENGDIEDTGTRQPLRHRRSHRGSQPRSRTSTTGLDYVPIPPSIETSEYSPPETTIAAEWKCGSMGQASRSPVGVHGNVNTIQSSKDKNDEGERGQIEQVLVVDGVDKEGINVESHRVSQIPVMPGELPQDSGPDIGALLRTMAPQELEKDLGRDNLEGDCRFVPGKAMTIHLRGENLHIISPSSTH
ncbi:hypothetical protein EDC04DRAFT_3093717 [Pisolithus marmoratus]|nr:hypothetical protein EDC04DRAFT_3093717 [Pisolithus marmoratus]